MKVYKIIKIFFSFLFLLSVSSALYAFYQHNAVGLGGMAENIMEPVGIASDFVQTGCLLIGGSFLFASIIKYVEHRRSPLMVPLSTVAFLFIAGLLLISLPIITYLTHYGLPYNLF